MGSSKVATMRDAIADLVRDGDLLITRTFESGDEALAWAEEKRATRAADGWTVR